MPSASVTCKPPSRRILSGRGTSAHVCTYRQPYGSNLCALQVSFHDHKKVKKVTLVKRQADVINRMNKTKREEFPDLAAEREAWDREQRSARKAELQATSRQEKVDRDEKKRQEELKSYKALMQVAIILL